MSLYVGQQASAAKVKILLEARYGDTHLKSQWLRRLRKGDRMFKASLSKSEAPSNSMRPFL